MFNVGPGEMLAICLLALIVLGPERLPQAMGQVGRFVGQMRKLSGGFQDEIRRAMDPLNAPFRPGEEVLHGPGTEADTASTQSPAVDEVKVVADDAPVDLAKPAEPEAAEAVDESMPPVEAAPDPASDTPSAPNPFDAIAEPEAEAEPDGGQTS